MERNKFPIGSEHYELYEEVGQGVSASVLRALCKPNNEIVAIKIIDFERSNSDLNKIAREAQTMLLVDHPNVLKAYCSFVSEQTLWVIMPFMEGGSCLHILKAAYPDGFKETVIATILREVLKGLEYLHQHGQIHRDVKAGNILVDAHGAIKLGDFGVSACLFDCGDRQRSRNTFVGTPCWMAPEVMEQLNGYDFKADIWSFGITAMELAHGHAPFSKYPPMKVLLMTLQNSPPGLDNERDKKFSKSFKQMIAMCLVKQPSKRPSARKLLKHPFFKQARSNDYIHRTILEGLPTLGDRIKELKRKDEAMLAQKKMPDGEKEEISQNEYKRGISAWDFNVEDMKAQAALIQDGEDVIAEKDQAEISIPVHELDLQEKQPQLSSINHCLKGDGAQKDSDMMPNGTYPLSALSLSTNHLSLSDRHNKTEDDVSIAGSNSSCEQCTLQDELPRDIDRIEHHWSVKPEEGISGRCSNGVPPRSPHNRGASSQINLQELASEQDSDRQNQNWNGQAVEDLAPETLLKPSKLPASNGESSDEKQKRPVVQQKGRFQVSSEKPNLEKASPSPMLQKSHSLQVMSQSLTSSLAGDATSSNPQGLSVFLHLHDMLQLNIAERDLILLMMKELPSSESTGNRAVGGNSPSVASFPERSLMEAANEREKELLQELEELHWRLEAAQEELQKFKMKNAQV